MSVWYGRLIIRHLFLAVRVMTTSLQQKLELALSGQAFDGLLAPAHQGWVKYRRSRNISLVAIVVAVWVQLRIRLDLGGQSLPRRPWGFRRPWIQQGYRYSCLHSHLLFLNRGLRHGNTEQQCSPTDRTSSRTYYPRASVYH